MANDVRDVFISSNANWCTRTSADQVGRAPAQPLLRPAAVVRIRKSLCERPTQVGESSREVLATVVCGCGATGAACTRGSKRSSSTAQLIARLSTPMALVALVGLYVLAFIQACTCLRWRASRKRSNVSAESALADM